MGCWGLHDQTHPLCSMAGNGAHMHDESVENGLGIEVGLLFPLCIVL